MSKDKNSQEIDLDKYRDPTGLSLKKMNFGLWLSEHHKKIMNIIVFSLIALSAFFFLYSTYNYVIYFLEKPSAAEEAANVNSSVSSQRDLITDLKITSPQIFRSGETYDLAAKISNPNDKFSGQMQYCFQVNGIDASCGSEFVLPSEEKYILALGTKISTASPIVTFKLTSISWQRVDNHLIPDWASFYNQRVNFAIEGLSLALAKQSGLSEKVDLNSLEFKITNRSPFAYYEVPLKIAFYNGSELIGVNSYIVQNFLAGETRSVHLSWSGALGGVSRTDIKPNLNVLDNAVYLKYQGAQ
ncbi:MAG: hypothetical protein WC467_01990 [Patescibacteria group bacterium]